MADANDNAAPNPIADLGKIIADGIAAGLAANNPKKVTFGQYDPKTPFHPNKKQALKLTRECYENGYLMRETQLFNAEIALLNKINRSGRYIDRLVEVIVRNDGSEEVVELRFKNRTVDQRFELKGRVRSMLDMLEQIVAAQDIENAEDKPVAAPTQRRPFGENKNYREAVAKAEANNA